MASAYDTEPLMMPVNVSLTLTPSAANWENAILSFVPASVPSMPLLARTPNNAVVSSKLNPNSLATGATLPIDPANFSRSNADAPNAVAMTSATFPASSASNPNWLMVLTTVSAVGPRSFPNAWANANVESVALTISSADNPNLAISNWSSDTLDALNTVDFPRSNAFFSSLSNSAPVAPDTAFTFFIANSKSAATLNDDAPIAARGAVRPMDNPRPTCDNDVDVALSLRWADVKPRSNLSAFNPRTTLRRD